MSPADLLHLLIGLTTTAAVAIEPMWDRMERLAAEGSFEDAAAARDRLTELVEGLDRRRRLDQLRRVERLVLSEPSGAAIELRRGRLTRVRAAPLDGGLDLAPVWRDVEAVPDDPGDPDGMALRDDVADELLLISRWLDRHATTRRIETVRGPWSSSLGWPATRVEALQALRRAAGTPR